MGPLRPRTVRIYHRLQGLCHSFVLQNVHSAAITCWGWWWSHPAPLTLSFFLPRPRSAIHLHELSPDSMPKLHARSTLQLRPSHASGIDPNSWLHPTTHRLSRPFSDATSRASSSKGATP